MHSYNGVETTTENYPTIAFQFDGSVLSGDPYRKCRSRNYRCCDDYETLCTEIFGGRYIRNPLSYLYCPTPLRYRRGYGRGVHDSYRSDLEIYEDRAYPEERDVMVVRDTNARRYDDEYIFRDRYGGGHTSIHTDRDGCTICIERRLPCSRRGLRRIDGYGTQCVRWYRTTNRYGQSVGFMRGYDGESAKPGHKRAGGISDNEFVELLGGIVEGNESQSGDYEIPTNSLSHIADTNHLQTFTASNKELGAKTVQEVRSIIDKSGNNRTWVLNIEDICRTECCRYKRTGDEGVLQKEPPHLTICKEVCWKLNNCRYEPDCKHKPPVIRFFESLGLEYLEKIHAIRLQTKTATFLNPFEVASAIDQVIRTFPKVMHAEVILNPRSVGEIKDKGTIALLTRTLRRLERHLPLVDKLKVSRLEQHPRLSNKWSARERKWSVINIKGRASLLAMLKTE